MNATLSTISSQIAHCQQCILSQTRQNTVPGTGSSQANIMFIGEGPGSKEDVAGQPFIGAAGKYLDKLLQSINLQRSDVFITNIVKCRPPDNRDPLPLEITTCSPYLQAQINIIQPLLICTLGRHAMNYFLPELKISQAHGQIFQIAHQSFLPLYHPAAGLYNPNNRTAIAQDFLQIPLILQQIKLTKK